MIDWGIVARAAHIIAVVVWIGGVWLVTTVLLPRMKEKPPEDWVREFDAFERRFAPQARIAVLLVVLSGLYMLYGPPRLRPCGWPTHLGVVLRTGYGWEFGDLWPGELRPPIRSSAFASAVASAAISRATA